MSSTFINVLILDDLASGLAKHLIRQLPYVNVRYFEQFKEIDEELQKPTSAFDKERPDLIFLDSDFQNGNRGWRAFLLRLRRRFPNAIIYLMSELKYSKIEKEFEKNWHNWSAIVALEQLVDTDSRISFFPKPPQEQLKGWIERIISDFQRQESQKEELTQMLLKASLLSYSSLLGMRLQDLCRAHFSDRKPVDPPYGFDIAVEDEIRKQFANRVHEFGLILATEEEGMQNRVFRRVQDPRFYLLSDPLDGSSALRKFLKHYADSPEWQDQRLDAFLQMQFSQPDMQEKWEKNHAGPVDLYSPTISMSLAQSDRVVLSVLINLFTGKLFLSYGLGNIVFDLSSDGGKKVLDAITGETSDTIAIAIQSDGVNIAIEVSEKGKPNATLSGEPFTFQGKVGTSGYLLGQLKAKPLLNDALATVSYEHYAGNIQPVIRKCIDVDASLQLRYVRNDFSPGPARVLFLSDQFKQRECNVFIGSEQFKNEMSKLLGSIERRVLESYRVILANGEPLTEWIHWFAFIQNDPGRSLMAYRLNRPAEARWKDDVKASMAPPEVSSAFKSGYFDIRTLYASFLEGMHRYTDTILVCRCDDFEMISLLEGVGFYDSVSRGIGVRIIGALDELLKQLEAARTTIPGKQFDALTSHIKDLQGELTFKTNAGAVFTLEPKKSQVRQKLMELQNVLEASVPENERALQIFIYVTRLFESWIHPLFARIQPAWPPPQNQ